MMPEIPDLLIFEKDRAGQRIYDVRTAALPGRVTLMTLDRLVALAAEYGTPHFRAGSIHYAYLPYDGLAVASDDEAVTKHAATFVPSVSFDPSLTRLSACVKAAASSSGVRV